MVSSIDLALVQTNRKSHMKNPKRRRRMITRKKKVRVKVVRDELNIIFISLYEEN